MNELINVKEIDEKVVTNTVQVARVFEKEHKNVMKKVREIEEDLRVQNGTAVLGSSISSIEDYFVQATYFNKQGQEQPMYLLTRDGFSLLAMGFTGSKALQFKLAYINKFNEMEETIKNSTPQLSQKEQFLLGLFDSNPTVVAASHQGLVQIEVEEATAPLIETIEEQRQVVENYDKFMNAEGLISNDEAAKALGQGPKKLMSWLRENNIYKENNIPHQRYIDSGYFEVKMTTKSTRKYSVSLYTPKGLDYIAKKLKQKGITKL